MTTAQVAKCPACDVALTNQGSLSWCPQCAYEPPEQRARPAPPPPRNDSSRERGESAMELFAVLSAEQIGKGALAKAAALRRKKGALVTEMAALELEARRFESLARACGIEPEHGERRRGQPGTGEPQACDQCDRVFPNRQARNNHRSRSHGLTRVAG